MMTDDFLCLIRRHGLSFSVGRRHAKIAQMEMRFSSIAAAALFLIARALPLFLARPAQGWSNYYFKGT